MTPTERAQALREAGWRQGSVCAEEDVMSLLAPPTHPSLQMGMGDWLVVVTQTCDLLQGDLDKEPQVECLRATPHHPGIQASIAWTQHPRYLLLQRTAPKDRLYACIHDRIWIPRERFENRKPDPIRQLSHLETHMVAKWLASRYLRPAYPDAFNERMRTIQKDLARFWQAHREEIRAVYCAFADERELPKEQAYRVSMAVVHPRTLNLPKARSIAASLERILAGCQGVESTVTAMADIDFSMAHLDKYLRWNLDWLSFQNPEASPLPPPQLDLQ